MNEYWIDFTPEPPKPPKTIDDGTYFARIICVDEKFAATTCRKYLHWTLSVEGVHPEFRLYYSTILEDRGKNLAQLYRAVTGRKPKGKVLITPLDYIGVRVRVEVRRRIFAMKPVNEILSIKHV